MEADDKRDVMGVAAVMVGQAGDEHRGPQWPGVGQRLGYHIGGEIEQCALVAGWRASRTPQMPADVE